ncbi:hypothetical protein HPB52_022035 [Rhipicephalus sanguineus]|uniref:Tick transposon n=1 Tax=Rhipicephalus sanguineus TaxID=34632 RepID=A0A9D4PSP0_RHISA|nr:hypothetical protein HPB52_022035 [Rhipicephalus sanguineus]
MISCATTRTSSSSVAEQAAIALALTDGVHDTIYSDSKAAIKAFQMGMVAPQVLQIIRKVKDLKNHSLVWFPAHLGTIESASLNPNEEAHSDARGLTDRVLGNASSPGRPEPLCSYNEIWKHHYLSRRHLVEDPYARTCGAAERDDWLSITMCQFMTQLVHGCDCAKGALVDYARRASNVRMAKDVIICMVNRSGLVDRIVAMPPSPLEPRRRTKPCAARGDELRATFLRRAFEQYVPAGSRADSRSKVQFRWPAQGSRTRPAERLLPGCSGRGQDRGRGLPGATFAGRGLTRVLGSCDLYCWVGRDSDSTALHTVAHPCAVKRASRATCVLAHVDDRIMLGRRWDDKLPRRRTKPCAARGDELRATFLRRAFEQYVPAGSRADSRSKVQFRWPAQGSRTRPAERLLPGCSGRGQDRGRGLLGAIFAGRGLTRVLGSCDLYCWVGRDSDSTALHTVAHPWAVKRASRATCVLAHVDDRIMLGRRWDDKL